MFVWICPECGREVPPHDTECPFCALAAAKKEQPAASPPATQAEASAAPAAPSGQPVYVIAPPSKTPGWLVTLLVAVGLTALGGGAYYFLAASKRTANPAAPPPGTTEPTAATAGNRLARFIEATGFRITEDERKRMNVRFLLVNHSPADIGDLAGKVYLKTTEGKPIADFDFKTTRLGPYESIEFTVVVSTTLRAYEVPDWQFLKADLEITSPTQF